jgi:drug/metabolite transporter (DMT)-like permease
MPELEATPASEEGKGGEFLAGGRGSDDLHRAVLLIVSAMLAFATLDGLRKALSASAPISLIVATRYVTFLIVVAYWLRIKRGALLRTGHIWLQLVRSTVMLLEATVFVYALRYASLADAQAVFALAPVAGVLLAILLLRERARTATWIALAVSFGGILLMLHPNGHSRQLGLWLALLSALLYALYGVLTRMVSDFDDPRTSFAYMTLVGFALAIVFVAVQAGDWPQPSVHDGVLLGAAALAAAVGQYLLISAYSKATAESLQPFNYLLFVWSVPISIVFFTAPPSPWALIGTSLVIGAGVFLFSAGRRRKRAPSSK